MRPLLSPLFRFTLCAVLGLTAVRAADTRTLHGHVPPAVARLTANGRLPASTNLQLAIGLPLRNREALTNLLLQLCDPISPNYQQYLTTEQFTERFGPTEQQYQAITDFMTANGFRVIARHPNRLLLDVTGSVADIERTFRFALRTYPHPSEPRNFHAPDAEPSVPAGLPIFDISGLDDFMPPRPMNLKVRPKDEQVKSYATGSGPGGSFIGYDFRAAYAPGVSLTGAGQIIGLFEFGPYFTNDIILYKQRAGLPDVTVTNVLLDGFTGIPAAGTDDGEETLDIDMAMCMAPGATIIVYEGNSAIDIFNRMATDNKAKQMSCSFGFYPPPASMDNVFMQFAAQGQTMFVASGDGGAYSLSDTIFAPADDPNITSVGGTSLVTTGPRGAWISESTWIGSGGGITAFYPIPSYQSGMNMSTNHGSTSLRNFPDVAILADTVIFWILKNGQTGTVGGTSAAAPLWAGFLALVNQQAAANGKPAIGNLNAILYSIGRGSNNYSTVFHDITAGNNTNTGSPTNFFAVPGFDLATGWGSPNGSNMIDILAAPTDALHITPGTGFTTTTPVTIPFNPTNLTLSLTNAGALTLNYSVGNTSTWLSVSTLVGTLAPLGPSTSLTVNLNPAAAANLLAGTYYANIRITNTTSGITQSRLFTLIVSPANAPITLTGFNAGVIVPANATIAAPQATGFDIVNNYCFYQAGLNANPQVSGSGGTQGLPAVGQFFSRADGSTTFQFGPYGGLNALMLGRIYPASGTLTFSNPQSYNSLAILASSANGGGLGTLVLHFTNGASSQMLNFNAQDWFNVTTNVALQGFGRLNLNAGLATENNGSSNPNLYQTTLNLAALGLNQAVGSITFTKPNIGGNQDSGVFAVSGSLMPAQTIIIQQPQSVTNNNPPAGATLSVVAMGTPPLAYQWFSGNPGSGTPVSSQTNANLVFLPVSTNQAGNYFVVVTNSYSAATSSVATLAVLTAPLITQQPNPTNRVLFAGQTAKLSVSASGAIPLSYFWRFNGNLVAGAIASNYTLANLQLTNSGNYSVTVSNAYGMATSSIVSLTVQSAPASPYATAVLADHPIAYWRLGETGGTVAFDSIGGNNGVYNSVTLSRPGYNPLDTNAAAGFGPALNSYVGGIPISFATLGNATFSVEAWVKGNGQTTDAGIVTKGTGSGGEQFNLDTGAGSHAFRFFVRDANSGAAHLANGNTGPNGNWRHLVGVCNESGGVVTLYVDGGVNASGTIAPGAGLLNSANAVTIGSRQSFTGAYDDQFVGTLDEVAIYDYALTAAQVQAHFALRTNFPPVFASNPFSEPNATAGQPYSATLAGKATDPNGDPIAFARLTGPSWLNVAGNGALSGTPVSADTGTNGFSVKATDPGGLFTAASMNILVLPAAPIFTTVSFDQTNLFLNWTGGIAPYQVQMTTNLANPVWQPFAGPFNTNSLTLSPSNDAAFYRILGQ